MSTTVIGEFDSFHIGHRNLVRAAKRVAQRHRTTLSALVLHNADVSGQLTTAEERVRRLIDEGVESVTLVEVSSTDADAAVERAINSTRTRVAVMACAPSRPADVKWPTLRTLVARARIELVEVERARDQNGEPITSDLVRRHLAVGDVSRVASLLGSMFAVTSIVRHGDARGRTIGFPTANLCPDHATLWPAFGVYAAWVTVGDERHRAAVNIGTRPTVYTSGLPLLEAHLLDFDGDLYGRRISVDFVERIRGEQRFESLEALTTRLTTDVRIARRLLQAPDASPVLLWSSTSR